MFYCWILLFHFSLGNTFWRNQSLTFSLRFASQIVQFSNSFDICPRRLALPCPRLVCAGSRIGIMSIMIFLHWSSLKVRHGGYDPIICPEFKSRCLLCFSLFQIHGSTGIFHRACQPENTKDIQIGLGVGSQYKWEFCTGADI